MSKHSHETDSIPRKKSRTIPGPSVKALQVTQDKYDLDKDNKVSSSAEGTRLTYVRVSPHPLLDIPPKYDNKRDYKGDTQDETPDSIKIYTNVLKKDYANLKRNLDKNQRMLLMMNMFMTNH